MGRKMIYLDNAATTFPKPRSVKAAAALALERYGGNPGRSGHSLSLKAAEAVFAARKNIAEMFSAEPENVIFTLNCTHALNLAIKRSHHMTNDIRFLHCYSFKIDFREAYFFAFCSASLTYPSYSSSLKSSSQVTFLPSLS